ncbi:MAG TPA: hypothetical protein P5277_01505 [Candidatus Paceibacterota bacterium]|nr:hypothetical protein [Candidatus Paceibacterota bacterium]
MLESIRKLTYEIQENRLYRGIGQAVIAIALGVAVLKGIDYVDSIYNIPIIQEETQFQRNMNFEGLEAFNYELE